ncbi:MAG TPA: type II toxin-antitoxin system VapC family toxin [Mycobacteriales bacterium]|nr:type II toxin-antitoxin system VapC family toxin [Mycobacteriales bacterium]
MIYLDTSAIVKLVRAEPESAELVEWLNSRDEGTVTSVLAEVETVRALRREAETQTELLADVSAVLGQIARFDIDAAVRATAAAYPSPGLRSLDAIHLATADQLGAAGASVTAFVTYDKTLARVAMEAGMSVIGPGSV